MAAAKLIVGFVIEASGDGQRQSVERYLLRRAGRQPSDHRFVDYALASWRSTIHGVNRPVQSTGRRYLSKLERLLMCCGLLLLFLYVANRTYSTIYSRSSLQSFWAAEAAAQAGIKPQSSSGLPDVSLWSEKRVHAYQASLSLSVSAPLGVLDIPSLRLQVPVLQGTDDLTLDRAVGHIIGTAFPGQPGNVGIAGHRDGFFRVLKDIHVGDAIDLHWHAGNARYLVDGIQIVQPGEVSVLETRARPSLTLVTCYPFYFVGSAPLRYIVHATATDPSQLKVPRQLELQAKPQTDTEVH